jgi:hypothetical protein
MAKELLKEAIADAKAVREVALQNAKMALEEAFDSKIKNMLSARLAEELEEDVELEEVYDEDEKSEGMSYEEDSANVSDVSGATEEGDDEEINLDELMAELEEMSYDEDEKSEGMKYDEDDMKKEMKDDDDMKEATLEEADMDAALASAKEKAKKAGKSGAAALKYIADLLTGKEFIDSGISGGRPVREEDDETNESIDIDALIAEIESELNEGKKKEDKEDMKKEVKKAKDELKEALHTVNSLKSTISEMNLLNSKLLYCNKLFRANSLTEAQKVKVVDALDLATTANEAKLVFSTLQESFNFTGVEKRGITEGLGRASKASGIAPKKVIAESVDGTISRFQKLANIKF